MRLRDLIAEYLDDQFAINGRLPRTLGALLFHPGRLTAEFLDGRVARYIPPFRLYVVVSVVFFLLLSLSQVELSDVIGDFAAPPDAVEAEAGAAPEAGVAPEAAAGAEPGAAAADVPAEAPAAAADEAVAGADAAVPEGAAQDEAATSWPDNLNINTPWPRLTALIERRAQRFATVGAELPAMVWRAVLDRMPIMMFLMLPVMAVLLKLLYVRSGRFYVEHFVFGVHFQTFAFGALTLDRLAGQRFSAIIWLYILAYLFLAMRRVYGQGRIRTFVKYVVLVWSYGSSVMLGIVGLLLLTLLLI